MNISYFLPIALSIVTFTGFSWAIARLFTREEKELSVEMRALSAAGLGCFALQVICLVYPAPANGLLYFVGLVAYLIALCLFWMAVPIARQHQFRLAFSDDQPTRLVTEGPYKWIRHPFYSSYMLFWVAGVLTSQRWILMLSVIVMGAFYYMAIKREEDAFAATGDLQERYAQYRAETGMMLPKIIR